MTVSILYGALRSGTTLLRLILDNHSRLVCPGERDFLVDFIEPGDAGWRFDREGLAGSRIFQDSGLDLPEGTDGEAAFRAMLSRMQADAGGAHIVLILHRHLDRMLSLLPEARVIHLVRDGRDVGRSSIGMGWAGNSWFGIDHWIGTERGWDACAPMLEGHEVLELRYEDLLADHRAELARICDFLGVGFEDGMLSYSEKTTYGAIDPNLSFQWRRKLSPEEVAELDHKAGDLLRARGYPVGEHGVTAPSNARLKALKLEDLRARWHVRFERYGVTDTLTEFASRRLGLRSMERSVRQRINEKDKAYLK